MICDNILTSGACTEWARDVEMGGFFLRRETMDHVASISLW